jgi:carbonic anhydrase
MWTLWLRLDQLKFGPRFLQGMALVSGDPSNAIYDVTFSLKRFLTSINSDLNELRAAIDNRLGQGIEVEERDRRLVELNVLAEVHWIMQQTNVIKAVCERGMKVHGLVYDSVTRSCVKLEISPLVDDK